MCEQCNNGATECATPKPKPKRQRYDPSAPADKKYSVITPRIVIEETELGIPDIEPETYHVNASNSYHACLVAMRAARTAKSPWYTARRAEGKSPYSRLRVIGPHEPKITINVKGADEVAVALDTIREHMATNHPELAEGVATTFGLGDSHSNVRDDVASVQKMITDAQNKPLVVGFDPAKAGKDQTVYSFQGDIRQLTDTELVSLLDRLEHEETEWTGWGECVVPDSLMAQTEAVRVEAARRAIIAATRKRDRANIKALIIVCAILILTIGGVVAWGLTHPKQGATQTQHER